MPRARSTGRRRDTKRSNVSHKKRKGYLKAFRIKLEIERLKRRVRDLTNELNEIKDEHGIMRWRKRR